VNDKSSILSLLVLCLWCCADHATHQGPSGVDFGTSLDATPEFDTSSRQHDAEPSPALDAQTDGDAICGRDVSATPCDMSSRPNLEIYLGTQILEAGEAIEFGDVDQSDGQHRKRLRVRNLGDLSQRITIDADNPMVLLSPNPVSVAIEPGGTLALDIGLDSDHAHQTVAATILITSADDETVQREHTVTGRIRAYVRDVAEPDQRYRDALETIRMERGLVGLATAVVRGRDIITLEAVGYADREAEIPIDPRRSQFRWASVSKGLAAIVALRNLDRIDLDANIENYLPEYVVPDLVLPTRCRSQACAEPVPEEQRSISLRMLLSHRAGIQHYTNGIANPTPSFEEVNNPATNTGMAWALPLFTLNPLIAIPGERTQYSSFGFNLAGVLLEEVLQSDYEHLVQENIAHRLGMNTFAADRGWIQVPNRVVGYRLQNGQALRDRTDDVSWKLAAGGFISTIVDFARYCGGLMDDVLLPQIIRDNTLWSPVVAREGVALGFFVRTVDDKRQIHHSGRQQNTATFLNLHADDGLCFVTMTNTTDSNPQELGLAAEDAWRRTRMALPD